jgi:hypothetical protein
MQANGQGSPLDGDARGAFRALSWLVISLGMMAGGCEDVRVIVSDFSEELRGETVDEGRSGTLRALEVGHRAAQVAREIARAPDPQCALAMPPSGMRYTFELEITREKRFESALRWTETRTFVRDASGNLSLRMQARYRDELGQEGGVNPMRLVVEDVAYEGPDEAHLYRRAADGQLRASTRDRGLAPMQSLLDAVPGWTSADVAGVWRSGTERLVCGRKQSSETGWLRRLGTRGSLVEASFEARDDGRFFDARWLLEDGVAMQVRAEDSVEAYSGTLEAPDEAHVREVRNPREWKRVHDLLERLERDGAIEGRPGESDEDLP